LVKRLAYLYANKKLLNLRECILKGIPATLQERIKTLATTAQAAPPGVAPTAEVVSSTDPEPAMVPDIDMQPVSPETQQNTPLDSCKSRDVPVTAPTPTLLGGGPPGVSPSSEEGFPHEWNTVSSRQKKKKKPKAKHGGRNPAAPRTVSQHPPLLGKRK
jgi:hypothetical protein